MLTFAAPSKLLAPRFNYVFIVQYEKDGQETVVQNVKQLS
jgi:hypothetical protein